MRKAFHQAIRPSGRIVVKENIELVDLAEPFELVVSDSEELLGEPTIAYFNPKEELEDKRLREYATKRRIIKAH